jgi:hypothetical protein
MADIKARHRRHAPPGPFPHHCHHHSSVITESLNHQSSPLKFEGGPREPSGAGGGLGESVPRAGTVRRSGSRRRRRPAPPPARRRRRRRRRATARAAGPEFLCPKHARGLNEQLYDLKFVSYLIIIHPKYFPSAQFRCIFRQT